MTQSNPTPDERNSLSADPRSMAEFETLLSYLKQSRGFDFTAYKRSSLMRRVLVRMQQVGMVAFADYQDFLQVDPEEFTRLFNTILINVTSFFRDAPSWEYLAAEVVPALVERAGPTASIRVWSAGCASGEEPYTAAILLAEHLGPDQFAARVKIYATDVDEEALAQARQATYRARAVETVPPELLLKYFDAQGDNYIFNKEIRRSVIFGAHDLIRDAPISRVNLLTCRNCLMYFNAEAQARILSKFHFALAGGGVLFLGRAETLLTHATTFSALDVKRRLFKKVERVGERQWKSPTDSPRPPAPADGSVHLREASADAGPTAQLVVNDEGVVVQANQQLRSLFGLTLRDLGRPIQDLELSYRPFELRSFLERAFTEHRPVHVPEARWIGSPEQPVFLELLIVPLLTREGGLSGASIYFTDVTRLRHLQDEVQRTTQELETALEELQSANEELETTNEELQSTVEELETTNEELQSTNEELETMNEELHSTNEELQAINDEARDRGYQLSELNTFLEGILTSLHGGVVVVDRDLQVRKWNHRSADMWGLRAEEVESKNFLNLDIGLPVDQIRAPIRACLTQETDHAETTLPATNRRGRPISVKVTCTPLKEPTEDEVRGVLLVIEELDGSEAASGREPVAG